MSSVVNYQFFGAAASARSDENSTPTPPDTPDVRPVPFVVCAGDPEKLKLLKVGLALVWWCSTRPQKDGRASRAAEAAVPPR